VDPSENPLASRLVLVDIIALSTIEVPWLAVPAYLDALQVPFSEVASTSSSLMALVLLGAVSWSFVIRGKLASRSDPLPEAEDGRLVFFAFIGYFWSLVDDAPVSFDSVYTWPAVTSGFQHILTEVLLHILTAVFFYLAIREAAKGRSIASPRKVRQVILLTLGAFWASYFQNTPLEAVQLVARNAWYPLDIVEHVVSVALLYFAIRTYMSPSSPSEVELPHPQHEQRELRTAVQRGLMMKVVFIRPVRNRTEHMRLRTSMVVPSMRPSQLKQTVWLCVLKHAHSPPRSRLERCKNYNFHSICPNFVVINLCLNLLVFVQTCKFRFEFHNE
jgi:hypothetical protein